MDMAGKSRMRALFLHWSVLFAGVRTKRQLNLNRSAIIRALFKKKPFLSHSSGGSCFNLGFRRMGHQTESKGNFRLPSWFQLGEFAFWKHSLSRSAWDLHDTVYTFDFIQAHSIQKDLACLHLLYFLEVGLKPLGLVTLHLTVLHGAVVQVRVQLHRLVRRRTVLILRTVLPDPEVHVPRQLLTVWVRLVSLLDKGREKDQLF